MTTEHRDISFSLCDHLNPGFGYQIKILDGTTGKQLLSTSIHPVTGEDLDLQGCLDVAAMYGPPQGPTTEERLAAEIEAAEEKAIDSLARYKFAMFGYWAGIWVHLNAIEGQRRPNPFRPLVKTAKHMRDDQPDLFTGDIK